VPKPFQSLVWRRCDGPARDASHRPCVVHTGGVVSTSLHALATPPCSHRPRHLTSPQPPHSLSRSPSGRRTACSVSVAVSTHPLAIKLGRVSCSRPCSPVVLRTRPQGRPASASRVLDRSATGSQRTGHAVAAGRATAPHRGLRGLVSARRVCLLLSSPSHQVSVFASSQLRPSSLRSAMSCMPAFALASQIARSPSAAHPVMPAPEYPATAHAACAPHHTHRK